MSVLRKDIEERKSADRMYAEIHPARRGELVRIDRNTLITIPAGVDREVYLARWQNQHLKYNNRILNIK